MSLLERDARIANELDRPAIEGGEPTKKTPYGSEKRYGAEELKELTEALEQGTLFYSQGKKVFQLEETFAATYGAKYGVTCSSGTTAIHTALTALGISPGDEVIVPPITDMGTLSPILYQNAVPVFADLTPHGYVLDTESVRAAITPRTKAVIAVQLWGNTCDMRALRALCDEHNIFLVEDCAQAFHSTYDGQLIGTTGHVGCFSFNEFKHISCGDGGIVITNDAELAGRLRLSTDKCYNRQPDALVRQPLFLANNYRMTELQGAVALAQLPKLESIVERRRRWCEALSADLSTVEGITLPTPTPGCNPSWWFYMMRVQPEILGADADGFCKALGAEGIRATAHYIGKPIYAYPIFTDHSAYQRGSHAFESIDYTAVTCPVAEAILETGVTLPVNQAFTDTDREEIVRGVRRVAAWFARGRVEIY
ncbi:MAG: DegT/DnrJ/EryC1/StrS family aminotransferase [Armatimonadota bacterium]